MERYCDYDGPSVYRKSEPKARKAHRCGECSAVIKPGEHYEYVWGIWEGYADQHRTCSRCVDLRTWVRNNLPCFCWYFGEVIEGAKEAVEAARYRAGDEVKGLGFALGRRLVAVHRAAEASKELAAA